MGTLDAHPRVGGTDLVNMLTDQVRVIGSDWAVYETDANIGMACREGHQRAQVNHSKGIHISAPKLPPAPGQANFMLARSLNQVKGR